MPEKSPSPTPQEFPSAATLCLEWPLYASLDLGNSITLKNRLYAFLTNNVQMDTFCPYCGDVTVLLGGKVDLEMPDFQFTLANRTFEKRFICSRQHHHNFYFTFRLLDGVLIKMGQSPAMADIQQGNIRQYRKALDASEFAELTRAVGLASHGIGIGSFVYLRRIFERLVEAAHQTCKGLDGWDEAAFGKARMDEKISLLKSVLPEFLVEQRSLYSILSKGIHILTEKQCLTYFPVIQAGIELILDQKLAALEQRRKLEIARKQIASIHQEIKDA